MVKPKETPAKATAKIEAPKTTKPRVRKKVVKPESVEESAPPVASEEIPAPVAEVLRGESTKPLFMSAAGCELSEAAKNVQAMHGAHRLPVLLKRVDALCRART